MNDIARVFSEEYDGIFFIEGKNQGKYPYSNSLLVGDYLFDTGISEEKIQKLKKNVSINNVVLSHWHEDHISGNKNFNKAKFYCHREDKHIIEDISRMDLFYGVIDSIYDDIMNMLDLRNRRIDYIFEGNDELIANNEIKLKVIHAPGHSAGHCCFYETNSKVIFLADIDLSSFGPWYGAMDSSVIEFERSIKRLKKLNLKFAFTSHSGVIDGIKTIRKKLERCLSIIYERDDVILSYLSEKKPKTAFDLEHKNITYKTYSYFKNYELVAERIMIQYHLDKLLEENILEQEGNGYVLK
ncbi:MAG: MBL fold metallo-hydrolase [Promethearchaeota archaeon]